MTDERINQLIEKHKKYADNAMAAIRMCNEESNMLTDALNYWQECDDVISCLEELKMIRTPYEEVGRMEEIIKSLVDCSQTIQKSLANVDWESTCIRELEAYKKALKEASIGIQCEYGGEWREYYDQYLKDAREQE